ncbi:fungal hydrophobin-domain-containing protein [Panaeolus papilionaceus]|nr:fungal hydrophobin-domain-containing protein [Panaeolus papilionaceus]
MFAFKSLIVAALPLAVIAGPLTSRTDPASACNTGNVQCCQTTKEATFSNLNSLFPGLGALSLDALTGLLGGNCSPISVVGALSGPSCSTHTLCCSNNQFNGNLIAVGCTPITLG